jgi:hypothetical protein
VRLSVAAQQPTRQPVMADVGCRCVLVAKFSVDPHVKGHDREFKLPQTKFEVPVEVAAVRRDRKTGEYTYQRACQLPPAVPPKPGVDLASSRSGSEMCGADPVGLSHMQAALAHSAAGTAAGSGYDFLCDSGSLQRLLATPYEPV